MTEKIPEDLIPIAEGEALVGHTRSWMRYHATIYRKGTRDYVSRSEILAAKEEYDTPRPKDGRNDE
jgi:hypothetical protein